MIPKCHSGDNHLTAIDKVLATIDNGLPASMDRLFQLLRFPTVATDPSLADCSRRCSPAA